MAYDPNLSPVGWYVASYLLRFVVPGEPRDDDPEQRFVVWENTIVVQAENMDEAYDKAVQVAQSHPDIEVQWVYEGLSELLPIYEKIQDGSELMWSEYVRKLKNIQRKVRKKGEFHQKPRSLLRPY
jgi:hypothetical protein